MELTSRDTVGRLRLFQAEFPAASKTLRHFVAVNLANSIEAGSVIDQIAVSETNCPIPVSASAISVIWALNASLACFANILEAPSA